MAQRHQLLARSAMIATVPDSCDRNAAPVRLPITSTIANPAAFLRCQSGFGLELHEEFGATAVFFTGIAPESRSYTKTFRANSGHKLVGVVAAHDKSMERLFDQIITAIHPIDEFRVQDEGTGVDSQPARVTSDAAPFSPCFPVQ
jgi:hypothetical protein